MKITSFSQEEQDQENGRMIYKGPFGGSISYYGLPLDILKSGLQKYIRRCEINKALWCVSELDMFRKIAKSKSIITNMLNRLLVICTEDIGIGDINTLIAVDNCLKNYTRYRDDYYNNDSKRELLKIVTILSKSKKIRLASHIRATYMNIENRNILNIKYPQLYSSINYVCSNVKNKYKLKNTHEERDLRSCLDKIITNLLSNNDKIFYHIKDFLIITQNKEKKSYKSRFRKKSGDYILWELLINYCKYGPAIVELNESNEYKIYLPYINILLDWYKTRNNSRNENWMYLVNAYLIILRKININNLENFDTVTITDQQINDFYINKKPISLDKYILDMHTKYGRLKGMTKKDFGIEGSVLVNTNNNYCVPLYLEIYNLFKKHSIDELKKMIKNNNSKKLRIVKSLKFDNTLLELDSTEESNILKNPLIVNPKPKYLEKTKQYVNYTTKPATYYAIFCPENYKQTNVLVKGPYKNNDNILYICMVEYLKKLFGLNYSGLRILNIKPNLKISYSFNDNLEQKFLIFKDYGSGVSSYKTKEFINTKGINTKLKVYDKEYGNQLSKWIIHNDLNENLIKQLIEILLFRQIINTSDTNLTNILINNNKLLSIDENYSDNHNLNIFFSHHQKKSLTNLLDDYIINNKDYISKTLQKWIQLILLEETKNEVNKFNIYENEKWSNTLIKNIQNIDKIIADQTYEFK